ncbi:hypothetical protein ACWEXW_09320 [Staphylococcus xylosus]|uniref:hypothetical protein n=1 Tax=Staphylococcus xylosus TaxID=1288 RepID=UPI000D1D5571|nr:hypothetical protein [Staphylococcus xylosus]PTH94052.1 hypothetical protein BU118_09430 [Staphylococcus xylosus]QDW89753.1 hypothetical protein DWB98_10025 [Staphylococcus xylosus]
MNYSEQMQETVEQADLVNKIQSVLDYLGLETSELEDEREHAIKTNQPVYHQAVNNNIKQNFVISSTLLAIRNDIESMHDDIQANIKQEKSASEQRPNSTDNA